MGAESMSELILYTSDDGQTRLHLRVETETVWLSQLEIAELFQTTKQNVSLHAKNIFEDNELGPESTVKESLTVQSEGNRKVKRKISYYNLDLILAIGYRVRSPRGVQFRQWASTHLKEFLLKGFVMDDERLKDPKWDYFDELLERIRDIRSSEKRFYQKVRDLFTLAEDYRSREKDTGLLFAEVQNKLFYAVTGHTAAELIVERANPDMPNMNLTSFKGRRVLKADVVVAKNYLQADELEQLNRLVSMFFEFAEFRAKSKQHLKLDDWRKYVDSFMEFNEQPLLNNAGQISRVQMEQIANQRYEQFDQQRKSAEAKATDAAELVELEKLQERLKKNRKDTE